MLKTLLLGLDLGQQRDYTVFTVIKPIHTGNGYLFVNNNVSIFELRTTYPAIVAWVREVVETNLKYQPCMLLVDANGVGRSVVDLLRKEGLPLIAITTTGGAASVWHSHDEVSVPKKDIVASLIVGFQKETFVFAGEIKEKYKKLKDRIRDEFLNFKPSKMGTVAPTSFEAAIGHDDIVMSLGLALWYGHFLTRRGENIRTFAGR